jgi:hypothetical protein
VAHGEVVGSTCHNLAVRPVGTPYPPTITSPVPSAFTIKMTLNDGTHLVATANATITRIDVEGYASWIGTITGHVEGKGYEGAALWEQFALTS